MGSMTNFLTGYLAAASAGLAGDPGLKGPQPGGRSRERF
jgi:hypothetical protein